MPAPPKRWFAAVCVLLLPGCAQGSDTVRPRPTATATAHTAERPVRPPAKPEGGSLDGAGYLAVADTLSARLSPLWDARHARYRAGRATITNVNADLLIVHSTAALARHRGAARDDARAVAIVRFLTSPPVWTGPGQGWQAGPDSRDRHEVFQAEVIEALQTAYQVRAALRLDAQLIQRIQREVNELTTIATTNDRAMTRPEMLISTVSPVMVRKKVAAPIAIKSRAPLVRP